MGIVWTKMRPACTSKSFEKFVIRDFVVENINGRFMLGDWGRETIYEIGSSEESFIPIGEWNGGRGKESKASFDDCVGVSFQQSHFVDVCEDMKGDEKYPEK
jgi:hypothetical protein